MSRRIKKPKTPEAIAAEKAARQAVQRAQDFGAVGLQPDASSLAANTNIEVNRQGQKTVLAARRQDAFDALRDGMAPGAYDAARKLEQDMRTRRGEQDRGRALSRVDYDRPGDRTDAAVAAAVRIGAVLEKTGDRDAWLLVELIAPPMPDETWRATVYRITGEHNVYAQAAAVRSACANLRAAYEIVEGRAEPKRRMTLWKEHA